VKLDVAFSAGNAGAGRHLQIHDQGPWSPLCRPGIVSPQTRRSARRDRGRGTYISPTRYAPVLKSVIEVTCEVRHYAEAGIRSDNLTSTMSLVASTGGVTVAAHLCAPCVVIIGGAATAQRGAADYRPRDGLQPLQHVADC